MPVAMKLILDKPALDKRIAELARELDLLLDERPEGIALMIIVLKGAFMFASDLLRAMKTPCDVDFIQVSSYGSGTESSGQIEVLKRPLEPLAGRTIVLVDDILDSGRTMDYLKKMLIRDNVDRVITCVLLDKPSRRVAAFEPDLRGFEIEDKFVVGYGLDYAERFRNLNEIYELES